MQLIFIWATKRGQIIELIPLYARPLFLPHVSVELDEINVNKMSVFLSGAVSWNVSDGLSGKTLLHIYTPRELEERALYFLVKVNCVFSTYWFTLLHFQRNGRLFLEKVTDFAARMCTYIQSVQETCDRRARGPLCLIGGDTLQRNIQYLG